MRDFSPIPHAASPFGRVGTTRRAAAFLLLGAFALALPCGLAQAQSAPSQPSTAKSGVQSYDAHIAEAAQRFGLPPAWIAAVMQVESAGHPRAVSSAGAMGLMQIMPATWAALRRRHGLGDDPFDPRDNILGGAAYLREMMPGRSVMRSTLEAARCLLKPALIWQCWPPSLTAAPRGPRAIGRQPIGARHRCLQAYRQHDLMQQKSSLAAGPMQNLRNPSAESLRGSQRRIVQTMRLRRHLHSPAPTRFSCLIPGPELAHEHRRIASGNGVCWRVMESGTREAGVSGFGRAR